MREGNQFHIILEMLKKDKVVMFTEEAMDKIFPAPRFRDPMKALMLSLSGLREEETQEELINYLCEAHGVIHEKRFSFDYIEDVHYFKLKL